MFFSINCLFLLSLGFLSWIILCYFNQIEKYILNDSNCSGEKPIGFHKMADQSTYIKPPPTHNDNYELYVNFLCIFACIYALAKITNIAEVYMAKKIHRKFSLPSSTDEMYFEADIIEDLHSKQENLLMKINKLEQQNEELKHKLIESDNDATPKIPSEESIHKVYISNKHIHVNRQVFVDQTSVNMNFQTCPDKRENINEIWEKYLKMQNKTLKQSPAPQMIDQLTTHMPVTMSNEELQKIRGLF